MTTALADTTVTPTALLDEVRRSRAAADAAEVRILEVAVEWAHAHPVLDDDGSWVVTDATALPMAELDGSVADLDPTDPASEEALEWCGIPPVAWDAPAVFAAANRMSTAAGKALIRDALVLRHRLPKTWARVLAGEVPAWRARRVAQSVLAAPADVVAYVDDEVHARAGSIGVVALDRLIERAMLVLHAEAYEADHASAVHDVTVTPAATDGTAELHARADWRDLHDLDHTLSRLAAALRRDGDDRDLDTRRARALGVLADPAQALALLEGRPAPAPSKQAVLHLHLTDLAVLGLDPTAVNETTGRAVLAQQIHSWLARTDTHVSVRPVLDLADEIRTESYTPTDRLREQTIALNPTCVFPFCARPARRCDLDHLEPWDPGETSSSNLAPLCRHHHRLKTHTAWTYRRLEPRVFLWTDPTGHHYRHDHGSTHVVATSGMHVEE